MFLKPKHFISECRPNFKSFCSLPGTLRTIEFSAPNPPPPSQISAYATDFNEQTAMLVYQCRISSKSDEKLDRYITI